MLLFSIALHAFFAFSFASEKAIVKQVPEDKIILLRIAKYQEKVAAPKKQIKKVQKKVIKKIIKKEIVEKQIPKKKVIKPKVEEKVVVPCLLYTSDAADE